MRRHPLFSLFAAAAVVTGVLAACSKQDTTTSRSPDATWVKKLHRGELSAIDSYDAAIAKFPGMTAIDLAKMRADHMDSADRLRGRIVALGATPDTSAGPWGDWAEAITKGGAAFGEDAGLRALQAGEQHGKNEYNQALNDDSVDAATKQIIRDVLLPRQEEHLAAISRAVKTN
jgi:hypothetical protein